MTSAAVRKILGMGQKILEVMSRDVVAGREGSYLAESPQLWAKDRLFHRRLLSHELYAGYCSSSVKSHD